MKRNLALFNFFLLSAVLFTILFQSLHSVEHIVAEFTEKHCHHSFETGKDQITHEHHNTDHCFACDFSFSNAVTPSVFVLQAPKIISHSGYSFFRSKEITQFFRGSLFSHRGPPAFIV